MINNFNKQLPRQVMEEDHRRLVFIIFKLSFKFIFLLIFKTGMIGMRNLPTGAKQPISLGRGMVQLPGTAMKRGTTAGGGAGARPMTAVSGAGFNSNKNSVTGTDLSMTVLEPKVET